MIKFDCPTCGRKLSVQDSFANKKGRCPGCKQTITIPSADPIEDMPTTIVQGDAAPPPAYSQPHLQRQEHQNPSHPPQPSNQQVPYAQQPVYQQPSAPPPTIINIHQTATQTTGVNVGMGFGRKSKGVAYLLWLVGGFGVLGLHRFYLGKLGTGLLWLFTFGVLGIGAFIDLFTLGTQVDVANALHR